MKIETKELKRFLKRNLKWIILFICVIAFLEIAEDVFENELIRRDIIGYELVSKYLISDFVTPIAKFITQFGGVIVLVSLATILFIVIKDKKIGFCIYLNLGIIGALNQLLKHIVQRPRPNGFRLIDESGYSFPSGHSMASAAFYGFLIYLIYKKCKNTKLKITLISLLSLLVVSIGISRIYLGVHYTTDVLAGFFVSVSYLMIYTSIVDDFIGTATQKSDNKEIKKEN